jgi:hypothetical protein
MKMIQKRIEDKTCGTVLYQNDRHKKWHLTLLIAFCAGLFLLGGFGVANAANGYVGLGFGPAWSTFDTTGIGFDAKDISPNNTVWRLFGGYQLNDYFGVEGGYIYLGKSRLAPNIVPEGEQVYFETKVNGFEFTPIGSLPVGKHLSVFARAGLIFWHSDIAFSHAYSDSGTRKKSGSSLILGLGAKYDLGKRFGVRAEYIFYAIDKAKAGSGNFNVVSINGVFAF